MRVVIADYRRAGITGGVVDEDGPTDETRLSEVRDLKPIQNDVAGPTKLEAVVVGDRRPI